MVVTGLVERGRNLAPAEKRRGVDRYRRNTAGDEFDGDMADTLDCFEFGGDCPRAVPAGEPGDGKLLIGWARWNFSIRRGMR